jgi:peptide chain release factor 2
MDSYELNELLKNLEIKLSNIQNILQPHQLENRLTEINKLENETSFWTNSDEVAKIQKEKKSLENRLNEFKNISQEFSDFKELFELAVEEEENETLETLFSDIQNLSNQIRSLEIKTMLNGETDFKNAIITIHPGAGGTESQDWASMLFRMYSRWAERNNLKLEVLDYQAGEEAGIKDVSFLIKGENSYGYLKNENGIHRLVRISPFDSNAKRHTSFASVMVSPEIDDNIEISIDEKDLRIDTYRASGAGGQHINKTESAIRITHIPTGIVVQCQNDRSQHKNKATAMKMLKSRLYELELEKQEAEKKGIEKSEIGWGHQIRSYVMQPYQQVKDSRSGKSYSNVSAILDGDLNKIIEDVLIATQL